MKNANLEQNGVLYGPKVAQWEILEKKVKKFKILTNVALKWLKMTNLLLKYTVLMRKVE